MHKTINSTEFRKMILVGAKQLELNRAKVDALNVFPVPDGDTGTNMSLTARAAATAIASAESYFILRNGKAVGMLLYCAVGAVGDPLLLFIPFALA